MPKLPSQLDHKCLGENVLTHLNTYWAEALEILCHCSVVFEFFTWCQAEGLPADQLSITEALYDAGGVWTQDIKGLAVSYFANNNNNSNNSSNLGEIRSLKYFCFFISYHWGGGNKMMETETKTADICVCMYIQHGDTPALAKSSISLSSPFSLLQVKYSSWNSKRMAVQT